MKYYSVRIKQFCSACPFSGTCTQCNGKGWYYNVQNVCEEDITPVVERQTGFEYSFSFGNYTIYYNSAYEFGEQVGNKDCLKDMGYNPYEPNTYEYDSFNAGYIKGKESYNGKC